jgi:signal transduction histidine kinase
LPRVFQQGFVTSSSAGAVGLHDAAVAVQEMGGRLSARSEGLGTGATFVIELPVAS